MAQLAISVVGPDRPGIIADVTGALAGAGANLEDSTMTLLRGHFAMMLICSGPDAATVEQAVASLSGLRIDVREVAPDSPPAAPGDPYLLSVHGADRPGIVSAVTRVLAATGGNITDLGTRLSGELYVLTAEVDLPRTADLAALTSALEATADDLGVGVTLRPAESDEL